MKFYIKPQLVSNIEVKTSGCILLKFYIKPQQIESRVWVGLSCILLKFYIKPQLGDDVTVGIFVVSY